MKYLLPVLICGIFLSGMSACTAGPLPQPALLTRDPSPSSNREVTVFAASSLTDAVDELAEAFQARMPGVKVLSNYAGSSSLATQLLEGGRADLFASANQAQMDNVAQAGLLAAEPMIFATNQLVAIVPQENPAEIGSLADLAKPGIRLVLALPGVPVRDYTDALLASLDADPAFGPAFSTAVYANLVSEETNVRQVAAKVALGEADAGVVYVSDITPELADAVLQIPPPEVHELRATYPIAVLAEASEPELAAMFLAFVLSDEGQAILQRWGFGQRPE